ncbi:MAG TPA: HAD-IA family hydrolase [Candidatus Saccharimonadia bacterium]|nr:HAD-IA family hydrolase [Candidatus Saccharimonadia bacterium]
MIKAIIFDVGGVLVPNDVPRLRRAVMRALGITAEQYAAHWPQLIDALDAGRITEAQFWQELLEATGAPGPVPSPSPLATAVAGLRPHQAVMELVEELKDSGYRLGIISNITADHAALYRQQGLTEQFDDAIFSSEVGLTKPDKRIYWLALERLGVRPHEAVFIDDNAENVAAAARLGLHAIAYTTPARLRRELHRLGVGRARTPVEVVDRHGRLLGRRVTIDQAYRQGLWHRGVHVVIYTPQGQILVQRRAPVLVYRPGLLDVSAGGAVDAGESPTAAAVRELREELGLLVSPRDLEFVGLARYNHHLPAIDRHAKVVLYSYLLRVDDAAMPLQLQPGEVSAAEFLGWPRAVSLVQQHALRRLGRLVPSYAYYRRMLLLVDQRRARLRRQA